MENNKSLLVQDTIPIANNINIRIPLVGEVLDDEYSYYGIVNHFTASPYSMMVHLDDIGIDFTQVDEFDVFRTYAYSIFRCDLSILFGNTFSKLYEILSDDNIPIEVKQNALIIGSNTENGELCVLDRPDNVYIDRYIFEKIADTIRKINMRKKDNRKPGNEAAKNYLLKKERRYYNRHKNDEQKPYLENLVVALVNKQEFKYNYEDTMNLSIYKFNRSVKQISHTVNFDKIMIGVYAGTVDTKKMADKSVLSFIQS